MCIVVVPTALTNNRLRLKNMTLWICIVAACLTSAVKPSKLQELFGMEVSDGADAFDNGTFDVQTTTMVIEDEASEGNGELKKKGAATVTTSA